jgi:hypothetical protein
VPLRKIRSTTVPTIFCVHTITSMRDYPLGEISVFYRFSGYEFKLFSSGEMVYGLDGMDWLLFKHSSFRVHSFLNWRNRMKEWIHC